MPAARVGLSLDCATMDRNFDRLAAELRWLADLGATWVELQIHGLDLIWRGCLDKDRLARFQSIVAEWPLRYTVHAPDFINLMAPAEERPAHLEALRACVDVAALIQAPVLVVHPGRFVPEHAFGYSRVPEPEEQQDLIEQEASHLRVLGRYARAHRVRIALENMRPYTDGSPYCYSERLDRLAAQVRRVDHPAVGIALDLGHTHLAARMYGFEPLREVAAIADLVRHIHVSDNYGLASGSREKDQGGLATVGRGDLHAPPGCGDAPLASILKQLGDFDGVTILELRPRYRENYTAALSALAAMREQVQHAQ